MANTYSWVISNLESYPTYTPDNQTTSLNNVVFNIHWRRFATDNLGHSAEIYGTQVIVFDPSDTFTPYEKLTQSDVQSWLENAIGSDKFLELNNILDKQIFNQINPPTVFLALPWASDNG